MVLTLLSEGTVGQDPRKFKAAFSVRIFGVRASRSQIGKVGGSILSLATKESQIFLFRVLT